jgi:dienelactone hydrolase
MDRRLFYRAFLLNLTLALTGAFTLTCADVPTAEHLPDTAPLELQGDIASQLVEGVDRFLLAKTGASVAARSRFWKRNTSSPAEYSASVAPNRERLAKIIGAQDKRAAVTALEFVSTTAQSARVGTGTHFEVFGVRWPAIREMEGEGLLLVPTDRAIVANVIAIPDAGQTPEMLAGLASGVPPESQFARRLAESGCRVVIPTVISRRITHRRLTDREFLYRSAFEMGRHLIGYEVQKVRAVVDWFSGLQAADGKELPSGVIGWGEGGLLALYASALDERLRATCVSGYFDTRQDLWQEPIDRNVFGLLESFGDAELASLVAPRSLVVEAAAAPDVVIHPGTGGGPGRIRTPPLAAVDAEVERANDLVHGLGHRTVQLVSSGADGTGPYGTQETLEAFFEQLAPNAHLASSGATPTPLRKNFDPAVRARRQFAQIDRHTQRLLRESPQVRRRFLSRLKTNSLEAYVESAKEYREYFATDVVGEFDDPLLPPRPRSRKIYETEKLVGYQVVLDVFPDVIAYGVLLLPRDLGENERRPVVVCQHGLEGRPRHVADPALDHGAYHRFAAALTERGFITFSPQNLYIFRDRFRTLQRKANPIKKTLFSVMVPQHQQIVDWLTTLPSVDPERIAFYGLSYGGKSAMRIPPLVERYCLSICSADFNEWVDKNASTLHRRSYVWSGEYEIFEFDLGHTFNYMEMAALIAPRPFMVERGHFDGVADDETVAYEFAKVRNLYAARLKIPQRCAIEWFDGPHTIHGKGTFEFLHKHLQWPVP